jgi:5-methylcytosine-specific restriction protein A
MAWSKESRQARGYGKEWERVRRVVLARDCGICQPCLKQGKVHAGTEVDHIVSKAKAAAMGWDDARVNDLTNLQAINTDCHKVKTQDEQGKRFRPKLVIGADGWPHERR